MSLCVRNFLVCFRLKVVATDSIIMMIGKAKVNCTIHIVTYVINKNRGKNAQGAYYTLAVSTWNL